MTGSPRTLNSAIKFAPSNPLAPVTRVIPRPIADLYCRPNPRLNKSQYLVGRKPQFVGIAGVSEPRWHLPATGPVFRHPPLVHRLNDIERTHVQCGTRSEEHTS